MEKLDIDTAPGPSSKTITITNSDSSQGNVAGWMLTDKLAKHPYTFIDTTILAVSNP